jgi:hypothetical protein
MATKITLKITLNILIIYIIPNKKQKKGIDGSPENLIKQGLQDYKDCMIKLLSIHQRNAFFMLPKVNHPIYSEELFSNDIFKTVEEGILSGFQAADKIVNLDFLIKYVLH